MFIRWVNKRNKEDQSHPAVFQGDAKRKLAMDINWQPEPTTVDILQKAGVDATFIQDCISEFILYWKEKGDAHDTWNTKFIAWVRRQWARFSASVAHPTDPAPMPDHWQPAMSMTYWRWPVLIRHLLRALCKNLSYTGATAINYIHLGTANSYSIASTCGASV